MLTCIIFFHALNQDAALAKNDSPSTVSAWPLHTDLVFADGGNKLKLTAQKSHVRLVIQDAIENIRSMILLTHAFPDITLSVAFAKEALLMAAKARLPETQDIYTRLSHDDNYLSKIHPLVSIAMLHTYG
jgi:hypothetical protein